MISIKLDGMLNTNSGMIGKFPSRKLDDMGIVDEEPISNYKEDSSNSEEETFICINVNNVTLYVAIIMLATLLSFNVYMKKNIMV
jgi:hypothetical protein